MQYALFPLPPSSALVGISLGPETVEAKKTAAGVAKESMRVISGECKEQNNEFKKMFRTRTRSSSSLDICRCTSAPFFKLDGHRLNLVLRKTRIVHCLSLIIVKALPAADSATRTAIWLPRKH